MNDTDHPKNYNLKIRADLNTRITKRIKNLRKVEEDFFSKKRWIREAIRERIETWETTKPEDVQADCSLNVNISPSMNEKVSEIVQALRRLKVNTSKSDFFIEAIKEKLDREEKES